MSETFRFEQTIVVSWDKIKSCTFHDREKVKSRTESYFSVIKRIVEVRCRAWNEIKAVEIEFGDQRQQVVC